MDLALRVTQVMHRALRPLYGDDLLWGWLARRIKLGCVSLEPVDIVFFNVAEHRVLAREVRRSIFVLAADPDWPSTTQRDFQKAVAALDAWFETIKEWISLRFSQDMARAITPFIPHGVYTDIALFLGLQALGKHKGRFLRFSRSDGTPIDVFDDGICMTRSAAVYFRKVLVRTCVIVSAKDRERLTDTTRQALWRRVLELDAWLDSEGLGADAVERLSYADKGVSLKRPKRRRG